MRKILAYGVHVFTASGAVLGVLALGAFHRGDVRLGLIYLLAAIGVDGIDGTLARMVDMKKANTGLDGALLDNLVDFVVYVIAPAFAVLVGHFVGDTWRFAAASVIVLTSAYQFSQKDAKTEDHYFKGFPDYWNLLLIFLLVLGLAKTINLAVILTCGILCFVPIKFIYPSRAGKVWAWSCLVWIAAVGYMAYIYPAVNPMLVMATLAGTVIYTGYSIDKTLC